MSYLIAAPDVMTTAAKDLGTIRSDLSTAHAAAAIRTVAVAPAAADEVSTGIAQLFSEHAEDYHTLAEQAATFHDQFVLRLDAARGAYAMAEAANAAPLQVGPASALDQPQIDGPPPVVRPPQTPRSPIEVLFNVLAAFIGSLMSFNLQYLQLQSQMQNENRSYTVVSNIMKTMHDTVRNSIANLR